MLQSIDLRGTQQRSSDQELLRGYLQQLVNQPFLHFRFSYGDELALHFGSPRKYASKRLEHLSKGDYIIAARASGWYLRIAKPPSVLVGASGDPLDSQNSTPVSKQQLETSNVIEQGSRILAVDPILFTSGTDSQAGFGLALLLSDGCSFVIRPTLAGSGDEGVEVNDWEVFTPYERCLEVGPGRIWAYADTKDTSATRTPA